MIKLCGTGHRPQHLGSEFGFDYNSTGWYRIINEVMEFILENKITYVISGMALGFDTALAIAVIRLKKRGYNIQLEAAIPCRNQNRFWSEYDKYLYGQILKYCDVCTVLQDDYTKDCMQKRNMYMLNNSDIVLAMWNGKQYGGTYNTVQEAKRLGKELYVLK